MTVPVREALEEVLRWTKPLPGESLAAHEALGRVLSAGCPAPVALPPYRRAAMDGYAVGAANAGGEPGYRIVGVATPAEAYRATLAAGQAVSIATGAALPDGAVALVRKEHARRVTAHRPEGEPPDERVLLASIEPGRDVIAVGDDIASGQMIAPSGSMLRACDLGALIAAGVTEVRVHRRPRVRLLITGDEIHPPGAMPRLGCVPDANGPMLRGLAERDGAVVSADAIEDDASLLDKAMRPHGEDMLVVVGGSSMGDRDLAASVLARVGELRWHRVGLRPGTPAGFGVACDRPVFLVPGNPLAAYVVFEVLVGPAIRALGGRDASWPHRSWRAVVAKPIVGAHHRTDFVRVTTTKHGIEPTPPSAGRGLFSLAGSDGAVLLDDDVEQLLPGEETTVYELR